MLGGWLSFWWGQAQAISPTGIPSGEAVGTPTIVPTATVGVAGILSNESVGTPTVLANYPIVVGGIPSGEAIGLPSLLRERVVSVLGIDGGYVGQPTVQPGPVTIAPPSIGSGEQVGAISVYRYVVALGIGSGELVPSPVLVKGVPPIRPPSVEWGEAVGVPTVNVAPEFAPVVSV